MLTFFPAVILFAAWLIFRHYTLDEDAHDKITERLEDAKDGTLIIDPMTQQPLVRETLLATHASDSIDVTTYLLYFTPKYVLP